MEENLEYLAREALLTAHARFGRQQLAYELDTDEKTISRWVDGRIPRPRLVFHALTNILRSTSAAVADAGPGDFDFIDLFAGIGGTRLGFERAGGKCVFTSEYDRWCVETYRRNFRLTHRVAGDIRPIAESADAISAQIPDHDVLVAGFPCQPFSIAGVSKKNALGRAHGFECKTQGTLFFDICRILKAKRPLAFMLENVRNLRSHDKGRTFQIIMDSLAELGYYLAEPRVIDAKHWVPQHRERIFIVGFREPTAFTMDMVRVPDHEPKLGSILHPEDGSEPPTPYTSGKKGTVLRKYTLTDHLWAYLRSYADKHRAAGNGFGYSCVGRDDIARTLSARYYKDGSEILISRGPKKNPRRLTPRECARLMGFPEDFVIPVSDTQAYKQFGNSVVVPVIEAIANAMRPYVLALKAQERTQLKMAV